LLFELTPLSFGEKKAAESPKGMPLAKRLRNLGIHAFGRNVFSQGRIWI
jgi:hypothetical protein